MQGSFMRILMSFHNHIKQVYLDAMPLLKINVVEHLFLLIIGKEDSAKVQKVEARLNRFGKEFNREQHK